jgi:hypothetical protein
MKMENRLLVFFATAFACRLAYPKVDQETLCFKSSNGGQTSFAFRYYLDIDANQQLGALLQYSLSKKPIILAFSDEESDDEMLYWRLNWLEVIGGKITGKYSLLKPKSTTIYGAHIKYKNLRTGRETTFQPTLGWDGTCTIRGNTAQEPDGRKKE